MEARYQELLRLPANQYQAGSPAYLEAGALLRDNVTGKVIVQLKLNNLSVRKIVACTVEVRAYAVNGDPLDGAVFQYKDLTAGSGENFGTKTPIFLPDKETRRIEVLIQEVVQEPFRVWTASSDVVETLPEPTNLSNVLGDKRHVAQYASHVGKPCVYVPEQKSGLFLCTCGHLNLIDDGNCAKCGRTFEQLIQALDPEAIDEEVQELLRIEEEERIKAAQEAEAARIAREEARLAAAEAQRIRAEETKQKVTRIAKVAVPVVAAVVLLALLITKVIIPAVQKSNAYEAAATLQAQGAYLEAEQAFLQMDGYKDSAERAKESRYAYAQSQLDQEDYAGAIQSWEELGDYSDSRQRAVDALTAWKESDYQAALALKDAGQWIPASEAFDLLGDYKDSKQQSIECVTLQKESEYNAALGAVAAGDYPAAMDTFKSLGDYRDAATQYLIAAYGYADTLYKNENYKEAVNYFQIAKEYEDAAERKTDSIYQWACQLSANTDYAAAITQFQNCAGYKDAEAKILDAKFGYVNEHLSATDKTTYAYMKELVAAKYTGAQKVFNELYAWKVEVVAFNNDPGNSSTNLSSLSKYQYMCAHFKVTGGEPGAKVNIRTTITLPSGQSGSIPHPSVSSGYIGVSYGWYDMPYYGTTGTLTFHAYDENNKLLCTATVNVTN